MLLAKGIRVLYFLFLLYIAYQSSSCTTVCLPGWHLRGGRCYGIYLEFKTWQEAQSSCHNYGGYMLSINSAEEDSLVMPLVQVHGIKIFSLGLSRQSGKWVWDDGSDLIYTNWVPRQPDSKDSTIVVLMRYVSWQRQTHDYHKWDDQKSFGQKNGYICEASPLSMLVFISRELKMAEALSPLQTNKESSVLSCAVFCSKTIKCSAFIIPATLGNNLTCQLFGYSNDNSGIKYHEVYTNIPFQ